jgi:hypothetical protein
MTTRNDASLPIALLLLAEGTLYFTFLFIIGPLPPLVRLLPLLAIVVLCAAVYWGFSWARFVLLLPIGVRLHRLALLTAAAWGLGRTGIALFLTLIILAEAAAVFLLLDQQVRAYAASRAPQTGYAPAPR